MDHAESSREGGARTAEALQGTDSRRVDQERQRMQDERHRQLENIAGEHDDLVRW